PAPLLDKLIRGELRREPELLACLDRTLRLLNPFAGSNPCFAVAMSCCGKFLGKHQKPHQDVTSKNRKTEQAHGFRGFQKGGWGRD
ncbi:hypothetical protein ACSOY7_006216, partial [Pseudomonas aeruginosa]